MDAGTPSQVRGDVSEAGEDPEEDRGRRTSAAWRRGGPSLLTGDPIVGILSGLDRGSMNTKTGAIAQAWILRSDLAPMDAKRRNLDDAICGDCKLRGRDGKDSGCYVVAWQGPMQVWKAFEAGNYPVVSWSELQSVVEGRMIRLGAYGDPAAIPFEMWKTMLATAASWIGYTHAWKHADPRFKTLVMASVDSKREFHQAGLAGWRTFRIRANADEPLIAGAEFICPASDEAGHRTTCASAGSVAGRARRRGRSRSCRTASRLFA
jgi:hypothetical protein